MDSAQRLSAHKPLQSFDAEGKFSKGERAFLAQTTAPQPGEILVSRVIRSIDDPQVLAAPALDGRLGEAALAPKNEVERLDNHAFAAAPGQLHPPVDAFGFAGGIGHVHDLAGS